MVHRTSPRAHQPFVVVNCAQLQPTMAAAVLLGHVRGAFKRFRVEEWVRARLSLVMNGTTGDLKVRGAALYADVDADFVDGSNTPVNISTPELDDDGQAFGTTYSTLDVSKQLVAFGVRAYNINASTLREMATAERKERAHDPAHRRPAGLPDRPHGDHRQ